MGMTASNRRLSRFAAVFAGGTLASRVLGMVREMVLMRMVPGIDTFLVAFRLPNMLREMVGEGAMNAAFVPVFSDSRETDDPEAFNRLVASAMGAMVVVLGLLTAVGVWLVPYLLNGVTYLEALTGAPGPDAEELAVAHTLARWTFPYLFLIGMTVFCMGPLFTLQRYLTPSWAPVLLNVSMIATCVLFSEVWPDVFPDLTHALVFGVWIGGIAQLATVYVDLGVRTGIWLPQFRLTHPGVREIGLLLVPVIVGQAAGEVNRLVDTLFAFALETGTVKQLYCANRLVQLPLSIFGGAMAVAVLPTLSAAMARADVEAARDGLTHGFRQMLCFILPSSLGLVVLGRPVVRMLFEGGAFTPEDTDRTTVALAVSAVGLVAFGLFRIAVTGFYAVKDTRTPVIISAISMGLNVLLNVALVPFLGYVALPLTTSIAFVVNAGALIVLLRDRYGPLFDAAFTTAVIRMSLAAVLACALGYGVYVRLADAQPDAVILQGIVPTALAGAAYLAFCRALHVREIEAITRLFHRGD